MAITVVAVSGHIAIAVGSKLPAAIAIDVLLANNMPWYYTSL